jgi:oxygen-independent coproporphyrinogen III oxidase
MLAWHQGRLYVREPDGDDGGITSLGLYLHLPFCDHKCAYCDFNSYAGLDHLIPAYTDALVRDIGLWAEAAAGRTVTTVFFGGGTPSLTPAAQIERILAAVSAAFEIAPGVEISLEANPGTVDEPYLRALRRAGISRLSLGVQSFDDAELRLLDRIHDGAQAVIAYTAARSAGFEDINLDLIFGLQGQGIAGWQRNVSRAIELNPEHLSLYGLTIESGTKLAWQVGQGIAPEPDPDLQADMYEFAVQAMAAAGYQQYEISNWSRPGRECRHNLIYWRNQPYLGLGAGAHSRFRDARFAAVRAPAVYIQRVAAARGGAGIEPEPLAIRFPHIATEDALDAVTDASDSAILGLRLNEGLDLQAFAARHGAALHEIAGPALDELTGFGLTERADGHLRLTEKGRLLSNEVFMRLLPNELMGPQPTAASR